MEETNIEEKSKGRNISILPKNFSSKINNSYLRIN